MRLKSKLVLVATGVSFIVVLLLSLLFLSELLRQRIIQTAANNDVMARQLVMMTRQAVQVGLRAHPPLDRSDAALHAAVIEALRTHQPLADTMEAFVRYSPSVQDASVTDAQGVTLVSTDPETLDQVTKPRMSFDRLRDAWVFVQVRQVLGRPRVLDVSLPLDRNAQSFLLVHIGVRSTFLKNNYVPWLKDGLLLAVVCILLTGITAGLLANLALRPIEQISRQLERLTHTGRLSGERLVAKPQRNTDPDAMVRVTRTIERLGAQIQNTEAGYTSLQDNLAQVLDTLREGVMLFTGKDTLAMASDAVSHFVDTGDRSLVGLRITDIFAPATALGGAVLNTFYLEVSVSGQRVRMEDGREVEFSIDHIDQGASNRSKMGTLLTLRDTGSALQLEEELEVSRRLAAVGRLTAGVGHEVKNPINAMVVHLELLRGKLDLAERSDPALSGAQRHVDILAGEMQRLDRVVQTLADFTRPMELNLAEVDVSDVVRSVVELIGVELADSGILVELELQPVIVRVDGELVRQALLNLMLNGVQSMQRGGTLKVGSSRSRDMALVTITDSGYGILPELLPKIFDLYFTTKARGSGIGLSMTYRIVQMHGGSMEVQSSAPPEHTTGSVFSMRLPAMALPKSDSTKRSLTRRFTTGKTA